MKQYKTTNGGVYNLKSNYLKLYGMFTMFQWIGDRFARSDIRAGMAVQKALKDEVW